MCFPAFSSVLPFQGFALVNRVSLSLLVLARQKLLSKSANWGAKYKNIFYHS